MISTTSSAILTLHFDSNTSASTGIYVPAKSVPKKKKVKKKAKKTKSSYGRVVEP